MKKQIYIMCLLSILVFSSNANSMKLYLEADNEMYTYMSSEKRFTEAELPVVLVPVGTGGCSYVMSTILDKNEIPYDLAIHTPKPVHLESGVGFPTDEPAYYFPPSEPSYYQESMMFRGESHSTLPIGTPFKSIIFCMGYEDNNELVIVDEIGRIKEDLEWAKDNELAVVGVHLEGEMMRNDRWNYNEKIIDLVVPYCDLVVVRESSNYDGKFTVISEEFNIPLIIVNNSLELYPIFQELFKTR